MVQNKYMLTKEHHNSSKIQEKITTFFFRNISLLIFTLF